MAYILSFGLTSLGDLLMNRKKQIISQFKEVTSLFSAGKEIFFIALKVRPLSVILHIFGGILETAASILTIYASAKLVSLLAKFITDGSTDGIWFWLWVDIAAAVITGLGFWLMRFAERLLYFSMNKWTVQAVTGALTRLDIPGFYDDETRNNINKVESGYTWQIPNLSITLLQLIYGVIRFIAIAIIVAQIGWWLIIIIALFLIPTLISSGHIASISWLIWSHKGDNRHVFAGITHMLSQPQKQMEIRSMQTGKYLLKRLGSINDSFYAEQEKAYRSASKINLGAKLFEVGGVAVGSIYLLSQFLGGGLGLDRYFFLSGALLRVGGALNAIFGTLSNLQEPLQFSKTFLEVIKVEPSIVDKTDAVTINSDAAPSIEFKNVTFTYPGQTKPTFKNLSLTIASGEHIALVGENGAGKSTLIKLLMRFYRPDSGSILINGTDLADISIESWYNQLATLFQSFNQYPLPIDENIFIAQPNKKHDKKRLDEAAKFGGVDKLIQDYEHGYKTVLDASFKKGVEPSGGQWQRVALARAFFRQANVLILDEPTAAIDAKAEFEIFNNIFEHYQQKTAIIVSHRFSTVRRANTIFVIEHGEILEKGSHAELMKIKGIYYDLFTKQAEGYKD